MFNRSKICIALFTFLVIFVQFGLSILAEAASSDREVSKALAAYFENRDGEAVDIFTKLRETSDNPVIFHTLRILWDEGAIKSPYSYREETEQKLKQQIERHYDSSMSAYSKIFPMVEDYMDNNNVRAINFAALMYNSGYGVNQDNAKAVRLYSDAAELGYAAAQYNLANLYYSGEIVERDHKKAVEWFHKSAEQGDAAAQNVLGNLYYNGEGVEQDHQKSAEWFHKSAEQGNRAAQNALGNLYYNGEGVEQDHQKSAEWFNKAAEQGNAAAQNALGNLYYSGEGVEQDYQKAAEWFRKAAEQGNRAAQKALGNLYDSGEGVEQDHQKAEEWRRKAEEGSH